MTNNKHLHSAGILVALLLLSVTALDWTAAVWPLRPGSVEWRFGALTALSGSLLTPSLGILILFGAALLGGYRWLQLTVSVIAGLAALGLAAACAAFVLDVLQLRGGVRPEVMSQYDISAGRGTLKLALGAVAALIFGILAFRAWRVTPAHLPTRGGNRARDGRSAEPALLRTSMVGVSEGREFPSP